MMARLMLLFFALAYGVDAVAAPRTVCFSLKFREARDQLGENSPTATDAGAKRGRLAHNTPTDPIGHLYELWDREYDGSPDKFIGRYIKSGSGPSCVTFEWEGNWSASQGEADPDVYVKYIYEVRDTGLVGDKVRALDELESTLPPVSWRDFEVMNCQAGPPCQIAPGQNLAITTGITSNRAQRVNALDTAQRALQTFAPHFNQANGGVITMTLPCVAYHPTNNPLPPFTPHGCSGLATAVSRSHFHINGPNGALNGRTPAHELGHLLHYNAFGQDHLHYAPAISGNDRRFDPQHQSLITVEGWPDFVNIVSWWDEDDIGSRPKLANALVENAQPWNGDCSGTILFQFVKGLWDLVDAHNEPGVALTGHPDNHNTTASVLFQGLTRFQPGQSNRQIDEYLTPNGLPPFDVNAANARDYYANNAWQIGFHEPTLWDTLILHQCLEAQDDN